MKKINCLIIMISFLSIHCNVFASQNVYIKESLKPSVNRDKEIVEKLKPDIRDKNKVIDDTKKVNHGINQEKTVKPSKNSKKITEKSKKELLENTDDLLKKEEVPVEDKKEDKKEEKKNKVTKQYIKFISKNGKVYYLVNYTNDKGMKSTKVFSEMNDEKLQILASGKTQNQINKEKEVEKKEKELERQKQELENFKNKKNENKKSSSGMYFLIAIIGLAIVAFKIFKQRNVNNNESFDDSQEDEDIEDYYETDLYDLDKTDDFEDFQSEIIYDEYDTEDMNEVYDEEITEEDKYEEDNEY